VLDQLADAGVPVSRPVADDGAGGVAGDVAWRVLWPTARAVDRSADAVNDLSLVVRLDGPGLGVVALGDVELAGQAGLTSVLRTAGTQGAADLVVMAHHGSARQDPDLAALLRPRLTVVSVGAGNDYGHPAASALDLYAATGSAVLRTDTCGPVAVVAGDGEPAAVARCR
jgi:competence protein ComEC